MNQHLFTFVWFDTFPATFLMSRKHSPRTVILNNKKMLQNYLLSPARGGCFCEAKMYRIHSSGPEEYT